MASKRFEGFKREIGNLPNMITIGRIFMIPPVLWLAMQGDPFSDVLAMLLFLLAGLLDVVDGWLARRQNLVTFFGKFVDPLADKIMVMSLLVTLVGVGRLEPWVVAVLLGREFYISGLRTLALGEKIEIVAGAGGKAKTAFQFIGICFVLTYYPYRAPFGGTLDFNAVGLVLIYASVGLSIYSALEYTLAFIRELARSERGP